MSRTHGESKTKLYYIWYAMRRRCDSPDVEAYRYYGARGIRVCDEWSSFAAFRDWAQSAGYRQGLTLDRINTNGNYAPNNCRWVTQSRNNRNKRCNVLLTAFGESKSIADWADDPRCSVEYHLLYNRAVVKGWNHARAITQAKRKNKEVVI